MVIISTMSPGDVGALIGAVQWGEEGAYVDEVIAKCKLPQLGKAIKGQYHTVGAPSLSNPGLTSTFLLLSGGKTLRVAAQCVKFKEGRKVVPVGPKLAIPETYDGFFEILSEDGRAVRCMETVSELSKKFPDSCLVRESLKAFVSRSDDIETITEKSRAVQVGETLVLVGEVKSAKNDKTQHRFLRCFDQSGQNVYLPYEAKGKFSAIAKEDNISGVHSIKNLLNKRLPLMVRLIHGRPPVGSKLSQFFPELRLFAAFSEESVAALPLGKESPLVLLPASVPIKVAIPKNSEMIEKTKEFLRILERAKDLLQELSERICVYDVNIDNKVGNGSKDPRFFNIPAQSKHRLKHNHFHHHRTQKIKTPPDKNFINGKEASGKMDDYDEIDQIYDYVRGFAPLPRHIRSPYTTPDQDPVFRGSSGPAKNSERNDVRPIPPPIETIPSKKAEIRNTAAQEKLSPSIHPALISAVLEKADWKFPKSEKKAEKSEQKTAKSEKKVEKRLRGSESKKKECLQHLPNDEHPHKTLAEAKVSNNKLFIKASQQRGAKTRVFRHKSASPVKEALFDIVNNSLPNELEPSFNLNNVIQGGVTSTSGNTQSPLFRVRYKSMTNLVMDFGTINSSISDGKNSTDSCGSVAHRTKLPEKRSRRLQRPKSLSNLAWDDHGGALVPNDKAPFTSVGTSRALLEAERRLRLEPGVYRHVRDAPALLVGSNRVSSSQKKIGTLYL